MFFLDSAARIRYAGCTSGEPHLPGDSPMKPVIHVLVALASLFSFGSAKQAAVADHLDGHMGPRHGQCLDRRGRIEREQLGYIVDGPHFHR